MKFINVIILLIILIGFLPLAEAQTFLGIGQSRRFEYSPSGTDFWDRKYYSITAGYSTKLWRGNVEYNFYTETSGAGNVLVNRDHREWIGWGGWNWFTSDHFVSYLNFGLGAYQDTIDTQVGTSTAYNRGIPDWLMGAGAGLWYYFYQGFGYCFETRFIYSRDYSPKPLIDLVFLRFGYQFYYNLHYNLSMYTGGVMKWTLLAILFLPAFAMAVPSSKDVQDTTRMIDMNKINLNTYLANLGSDLVKESADTDGQGKPDTWVVFKKGSSGEKQVVMQLFDLNHDGKVDLVKHYAKGVMVKTEADLDYDGKVDVVSEYDSKTGNLVKKYQADGKTNIVKYWYNNELRRKELDRNGDGRPDMWVHYQGGKVIKTELDVNFDGKNIRVENSPLNKKVQ